MWGVRMKVVFIHPPPGEVPSGGHEFNRQLVAEAARTGFPLEAFPLSPEESVAGEFPSEPGGIVLWDSLFLERLAAHPPVTGGAHGLLVHYLPFLDPGLDAESRRKWAERFDRAVFGLRFLVATGQGAARRLERRYSALPVFLCEPGVDSVFAALRRAGPKPTAGQPVRIATVANLLPAKGQLELLEILARLESPTWEWHLAGHARSDPAYAEEFWKRAAHLRLAERIVHHGVLNRPELARWLGRMDLFAFPSRYEAYGMALAEAKAAGLPMVTTAVGESERLVRHGVTGFVVPVGDSGRFRAALARLVTDEALRWRFRDALEREPPRRWEETFGDFEAAMRAVDSSLG